MKYVLLTLTVFANLLLADTSLNCKVSKIDNPHGIRFGRFYPKLPIVGDDILVDLSHDTITDLMGPQGRGIPLAHVGAQLKRTSENFGTMQVFHGTFVGDLGNTYSLTLTARESASGANVHLSLIKSGLEAPIDLICLK